MDADELEDCLELEDSQINRQIEKSNLDIQADRIQPAASLLSKHSKAQRSKSKGRQRQQK